MYLEEQRLTNQSYLSDFVLLELSEVWELKILYFIGFLVFYLAAAMGNFLIIAAIAFDYHLHTPMNFFLLILAIQDIGQLSVIFLSFMANSLMNVSHISYSGCVAQVFFYVFFIGTDLFLLTVMAYDRYVAICNPLQYERVMNRQACLYMVIAAWIGSLICAVLHTGGTFAPCFCSNVVNQFFCEIPHLVKLACSDLSQIEFGVIFVAAIVGLSCFLFVIVSYVYIFTAVLKISSAQKRQKVFSTCLPHLIVFSTFRIAACFVYLKPISDSPSQLDLSLTVIYSIIPPLMNPVVYSMRNKQIKNAMVKLFGIKISF